ncbi:MAG: DUF4242 domain-containing protein [Tetrasphaera sp.]
MPIFLIERDIPAASSLTPEELAGITAKSNEVVASLGVPYRWITSYVAGDKFYCVHEADHIDTVLAHAKAGGFPANLVTEVVAQIDPDFVARRATAAPVAGEDLAPSPPGSQP